jgi:hypothetical protein
MKQIYDFIFYRCHKLISVLYKICDWAREKSDKLSNVVEE